jgi:hypothetical protein
LRPWEASSTTSRTLMGTCQWWCQGDTHTHTPMGKRCRGKGLRLWALIHGSEGTCVGSEGQRRWVVTQVSVQGTPVRRSRKRSSVGCSPSHARAYTPHATACVERLRARGGRGRGRKAGRVRAGIGPQQAHLGRGVDGVGKRGHGPGVEERRHEGDDGPSAGQSHQGLRVRQGRQAHTHVPPARRGHHHWVTGELEGMERRPAHLRSPLPRYTTARGAGKGR